jgi:hypothetical protein
MADPSTPSGFPTAVVVSMEACGIAMIMACIHMLYFVAMEYFQIASAALCGTLK